GRLLKSIRDDELVANVLGKRTPRVKGTVLVIGSGMAAVAGVLNAFYQQSVLSVDYIPQVTFLALTMVLLGGLANHRGAVAGVLLLDEPTAALAPKMVGELFRRILEIRDSGVSILLIEQYARKALEIADRGYVLVAGRKATEG